MNWNDQWRALSGRIVGLLHAGDFVIQSLQVSSDDAYGTTTRVSNHAKAVVDEIAQFSASYGSILPASARAELDRFLREDRQLFHESVSGFQGMRVHISTLAAFRASFEYHASDLSLVAKSRTERAFIHLQQTIVADDAARDRWERAFGKNEMACEHLGALHLLSHGVWTFKAHGPGARTDLVCGEALQDPGVVERAAETLVLTEWKRVEDPKSALDIAATARNQAHLYGKGILSAIELADQRYVILVSGDRLPTIPDVELEGIRYRHVNVAVTPSVPSRAALPY